MPCGEFTVHQNSIFDLIWLQGSNMILTGSADKESVAFDLERGQEALRLSSVHEASIKTVT